MSLYSCKIPSLKTKSRELPAIKDTTQQRKQRLDARNVLFYEPKAEDIHKKIIKKETESFQLYGNQTLYRNNLYLNT